MSVFFYKTTVTNRYTERKEYNIFLIFVKNILYTYEIV